MTSHTRMTREEAQSMGLDRFLSSEPCRFGALDWRNAKYGFCFCADCKAYRKEQTRKSAERRRQREMNERTHDCAHCGGEFKGRKRKYCGEDCAAEAKRARERKSGAARKKAAPTKLGQICASCGLDQPMQNYRWAKDPKCLAGGVYLGRCRSCEGKESAHRRARRTGWIARMREYADRRGLSLAEYLAWRCKDAEASDYRVMRDLVIESTKVRRAREREQRVRQAAEQAAQRKAGRPRFTQAPSPEELEGILYQRIRSSVKKYKRKGFHPYALNVDGRTASEAIEGMFGYTLPLLVGHIERQFTKGMDWVKFCNSEIHIDHILPVMSFDLADINQLKSCYSIANLRPMWASDNIRKSCKRLVLL